MLTDSQIIYYLDRSGYQNIRSFLRHYCCLFISCSFQPTVMVVQMLQRCICLSSSCNVCIVAKRWQFFPYFYFLNLTDITASKVTVSVLCGSKLDKQPMGFDKVSGLYSTAQLVCFSTSSYDHVSSCPTHSRYCTGCVYNQSGSTNYTGAPGIPNVEWNGAIVSESTIAVSSLPGRRRLRSSFTLQLHSRSIVCQQTAVARSLSLPPFSGTL